MHSLTVSCPLWLWLSKELRSGSWHILMSNIWSKYEFLLFYSHFWTGHESGTSLWTDGHRERRVEMKLCWHYNEILCISLSLIRLVESRVCGDAEGVGGGGGVDILVLIMKYFSFPSRGRGYKEVILLLYFCHTVEPFWIYWVYVNTITEQVIL